MNTSPLEVIAIENPADLSDATIQEIQTVSQDIWSRRSALGELCQCESCHAIYAAEDIFEKEELEKEVVGTLIQRTYGNMEILCKDPKCMGKTKYIFGPKHIEDIRARYKHSVRSFLVLCKEKETGKIVGLEDGYIGAPNEAIEREFQHYDTTPSGEKYENSYNWIAEIENGIKEHLGYLPEKILTLSSIGVIPRYQSPFVLFEILKRFAEILPENYTMPGITEIDTRSPINILTKNGGGRSLHVRVNSLKKQPYYQSELVVSTHPILAYKESLTHGPKAFIRLLRQGTK